MKKALTHLSLAAAHAGKIARLDAVAVAYRRQVQVDVDTLIAHDEQAPDPYAHYPARSARVPLSVYPGTHCPPWGGKETACSSALFLYRRWSRSP